MRKVTGMFLLCAMGLCMCIQMDAQKTKNSNETKTQNGEDAPPLPPPPNGNEMVAIDTFLPGQSKIEYGVGPMPQVDFDTTLVPDDKFTHDILQLLELTNAMNMGMQFAQAMRSVEPDSNNIMGKFYERFIEDMRTGTAYRWMKRIYVRYYRKYFTNPEIEELIRFYESPLGKKITTSATEMLPAVINEGKKMGEYIGIRMYMEVLKENKD